MTDSVLGRLQEKWKQRPRWVMGIPCTFSHWSKDGHSITPIEVELELQKFGVLLSQSIEELQKQAKTTSEIVTWGLGIKKDASKPYVRLTRAYELWVRLDAVADTEKKEETK